MTLNQIRDEILHITGNASSATAFWGSDANLFIYINRVGQNIPIKVGMVLGANGKPVLIDFWKTTATSATTGSGLMIATSSSTGYLPVDCYYPETFYDLTNKKPVYVIHDPLKHWRQIEYLKNNPAGPPEAIELLDTVTNSTNWQRRFTIHPSTLASITPSMQLSYYRLPATMPGVDGTAEYPDAPVEFHSLWVYGTVVELMARNDPNYDRYKGLHDEVIQALASHARIAE
jgi:hypothetical protein